MNNLVLGNLKEGTLEIDGSDMHYATFVKRSPAAGL